LWRLRLAFKLARMKGKTLAVLATLLAGAACASKAPSVRRDQRLGPGEGVVIGKLGFGSRQGDPLTGAELTVVDDSGRARVIDLDMQTVEDNGQSASFFVSLPPGRYQLTKTELRFSETWWQTDDTGLQIEVTAGKVVCVGAAYIRARGILEGASEDGQSGLSTQFVVQDECGKLRDRLAKRAPFLNTGHEVSLARPRGS
jgi:hypothetical protein